MKTLLSAHFTAVAAKFAATLCLLSAGAFFTVVGYAQEPEEDDNFGRNLALGYGADARGTGSTNVALGDAANARGGKVEGADEGEGNIAIGANANANSEDGAEGATTLGRQHRHRPQRGRFRGRHQQRRHWQRRLRLGRRHCHR